MVSVVNDFRRLLRQPSSLKFVKILWVQAGKCRYTNVIIIFPEAIYLVGIE